MPEHESVALNCPAKVNLALSVGAVGPDGMHPISSWMVAVQFGDRLTLEPVADHAQSSFDIRFVPDRGSCEPHEIDWPLEQDLAFRAVALVEHHTARRLPVKLILRKRIPVGAGLGGGSSNAAATLQGLNRCYRLGLDQPTLRDLGAQLGSDVPFLVAAQGGVQSAVVRGLGERLEASDLAHKVHLVLILPPFGCPTGSVYQRFDIMQTPQASGQADRATVERLAAETDLDHLFNDLAAAACAVEPRLATLRAQIETDTARTVHVTGSGAAMFIVGDGPDDAEDLARLIAEQTGVRTVATHS